MSLIRRLKPGEPISGRAYLLAGITLAAVKFGLDSLVAARFAYHWTPLHYWFPHASVGIFSVPAEARLFYVSLTLLSVPFVILGVLLTLRRLRTLGLEPRLVLLFFAPFVNVPFFLALGLVRGRNADGAEPAAASLPPRRPGLHPLLGGAIAAVFALAVTWLGAEVLFSYGWGMLVGLPFVMGYLAAAISDYPSARSQSDAVEAAASSVAFGGASFLVFGLEGMICLVMLLPAAFPLAIAGGLVAHIVAARPAQPQKKMTASLIIFLPLLITAESLDQRSGRVLPVRSSVVIDAPAEQVWRNVVTFSPIPEPTDWILRAGIAYPTHAEIRGEGPGAIRYCVFSTGAFVEPIEIWEPGRRLRFAVSAQPPVMRELSPYDIEPPHVRHEFLRSHAGEFRLRPLPDGSTLLEGTTWYEVRFAPEWYWRLWSDWIIHRIHLRVLQHIKVEAEREAKGALAG